MQGLPKITKAVREEVLPAMFEPTARFLGNALNSELASFLPNQAELDRILRGIAADQLLRPTQLDVLTRRVDALSKSLADPAQARTQLAALQTELDSHKIWPEDVALEVGLEILRFSGHKWIDSDVPPSGAFLSNIAISALTSTKGSAGNVGEALCGLIPEVGAAVCSAYKQVLDTLFDYAAPQLAKNVISASMHGALDNFIGEVGKAYKANKNPGSSGESVGVKCHGRGSKFTPQQRCATGQTAGGVMLATDGGAVMRAARPLRAEA